MRTGTAALVISGLLLVLLCISIASAPLQTSAQTSPLKFEVATIKPSSPDEVGGGVKPLPGGQTYVSNNMPLRVVIRVIYKIPDSVIIGGPNWINTDLWDIQAKAPRPSSMDDLHEMFKTLLADRFKLRFHYETKDMSAYVLTVDKAGSKLQPNGDPESFDVPIKPVPIDGGMAKLNGTRVPMSYLSYFLAYTLNTPVIDNTALKGNYDFTMTVPFRSIMPNAGIPTSSDVPEGPSLFTALREQLGLRLDSRKAPVRTFVIDSAEKPTAN